MPQVELVRGYKYNIMVHEVGSTGKIGLNHLFNYLQDAAHCDALGLGFGYPQMLKHDRLWVLSRMSLIIDDLPSSDDEIEVRTWVKSVNGPGSEREFSVRANNKEIVRASSFWFCLSASEHKPARIPMENKLKALINDQYSVDGGAKKIKPGAFDSKRATKNIIRVKYSDVDMVNHVNNASYVRWVMDEAMEDYSANLPGLFTINYLGEVHHGDSVEVAQQESHEGTLFHEITKADTGKVVCRTETVWKKA